MLLFSSRAGRNIELCSDYVKLLAFTTVGLRSYLINLLEQLTQVPHKMRFAWQQLLCGYKFPIANYSIYLLSNLALGLAI